jgi:hypothetical protein
MDSRSATAPVIPAHVCPYRALLVRRKPLVFRFGTGSAFALRT